MTVFQTKIRPWLRRRRREWREARRSYYKISPHVITEFARQYPSAYFIQVGVNDGSQQDPFARVVERSDWRGLMVEPVPYVFERLKRNKQGVRSRVQLANVAIAGQRGTMPFWYLQEDPDLRLKRKLYDALGSFRKEVVLSHKNLIPDIEERLTCQDIAAITFDDLCREHGVTRVDVLQIDTEGYDFEILKHIDFVRWRPGLLMFEHLHLSPADKQASRTMMQELGYESYADDMDVLCVDACSQDLAMAPVFATWRRLRASRKFAKRLGI